MQTMLSTHEMTTLMIAWDAPDQIELERDELVTLIEHRLIAVDQPASGCRRVQVTAEGRAVLKAVSRMR